MKHNGTSGPWTPSESTEEGVFTHQLPPWERWGQSVPGLEEVVVKVSQGPAAPPIHGPHLYIRVKALLTPLLPVALCVEGQFIGAWFYFAWCQETGTATIQVCVAGKRQREELRSRPPLAFLLHKPMTSDDPRSGTQGAQLGDDF